MKSSLFFAIALSCLAGAAAAQTTPQEGLVRGRAVEAVIWGMPAANYDLMLQAALKAGAKENEMIYWSRPLDWHNQTLTPNPDALYFMTFFNTKDVGPVVIDVPPAEDGSFNGNIVNVWQMPLEDAGPPASTRARAASISCCRPATRSKVPDGYIPLQSDTFGGYALFRSNLKSHSDADIAKSVAYGKRIKVYPLSQAANPRRRSSPTPRTSCSIPPSATTRASSVARPHRADRALARRATGP